MKLRHTAAAALASLALILTMPGSASAAVGDFHYKYVDEYGKEQRVVLHNPHSGKCVNLHAVGEDDELPGYGPQNSTDSTVTVYLGAGCTGPEWRLRPHGRPATDELEVRSVRFEVRAA
ncbi:hypothetical protein ACFWBH_37850 [Streptomyces sp. NPDC059999]|uniref:hypothetical protein n=1 Tax=unclassified Streptomyces TaxID=2593676 RepID=UPI002E356FD9|nr:hypothetical protein [Streptomyces sp. NBC_01426]